MDFDIDKRRGTFSRVSWNPFFGGVAKHMEYVYFYCFCDDDISKVSVSCLIYMINVKLTNCFAGISWKTRQTRTNQLKLMFLRGCLVSRLNPWDGMSEFWSRPEYFRDEQ